MRALATCAIAVVLALASSFALSLVPAVEVATLAARAALADALTSAKLLDARTIDERIVLVDVASPADPERLADVVELALANGARAIALIATPSAPNERLSAALADCQCVVVPEGHALAPVSAQRGHVMVHADDDEPLPRIVLTGKDAGASGAALALALSRAAGTPATLEGRADALVRPRRPAARVLSLDDVITPRVDLARTFRPAAGASIVLVGDARTDALVLHASLLHELMHGRLLDAPPRSFTVTASAVLALLACALASLLLARRRAVLTVLAVVVACVLEVAWWANATAALAVDDVWLPVAAPTCALTLALIVALVRSRPPRDPSDDQDDDDDDDDEDP